MAVSLVLLAVVVVPAAVLYYFLLRPGNKRRAAPDGRSRPLPPSPPGLPLIGHLHLLGSLPHRSLRSLAAAHGGAPVMLLRLGRVPTVVVSSSAGAEEVMRARDLDFASRPATPMADRLLYGRDVAFAPYGEYWRQARRICVTRLLSAHRVRSFRRVREQEAAALVARVRADAVGDMNELLVAFANSVVSRAAFGDETARGMYGGDGGRKVRKALTEFRELLGTVPVGEILPWLGWVDGLRGIEAKITRTFQALDGLLEKVIDEHRSRRCRHQGTKEADDGDDRDFVDVLLDVHENNEEYGIRLGTNEIKGIILDMFAAGTDTTSTVLEWAMAELVTHPASMRRLQDEIRSAVGSDSDIAVTEDHLAGLRYLRAVVKETLRLHAPVPLLVPREPTADAELLGYRVPARTRVVVNAWAIGRDPAAWGHDAEEFAPERFVDSGVDYRGQDFALVPFGAGRRGCPGVGFAEASVELALASLLYHFDWEAAGRRALDMGEENGMTVHIKAGLPLVAKPWIPS